MLGSSRIYTLPTSEEPEAGGQVDALAFTSGKGVGETVEGEVSKSHIQKELQAVGNLGQEVACPLPAHARSAPASGTMRLEDW